MVFNDTSESTERTIDKLALIGKMLPEEDAVTLKELTNSLTEQIKLFEEAYLSAMEEQRIKYFGRSEKEE